jgi:ADP-heptose:LPS heptosyltransferase
MAPLASGQALVGPGPGEVDRHTPLDGAEAAAWLGDETPGSPFAEELGADAVLALTRSPDLLERLRGLAPRVLFRDPTPPPAARASHWYAEPTQELGADPSSDPPPLVFAPAEEESARAFAPRLPRGFLAVHPGSGSATKNWPAERLAYFVRAHTDGRPWLLVSGPADEEGTGALSPVPGLILARDLPVRVLGALLARAGLYVGNDSGVTHLAAATGAPTLALFGPTSAETWGPDGPRVEAVSSPDGTMEGLDLARVQDAAARLLERS